MDEILSSTVTVVVMDGDHRPVDGQLLEVRPTMSVQLGVEVGEDPALQQRILGEVDPPDDMAWLELHI